MRCTKPHAGRRLRAPRPAPCAAARTGSIRLARFHPSQYMYGMEHRTAPTKEANTYHPIWANPHDVTTFIFVYMTLICLPMRQSTWRAALRSNAHHASIEMPNEHGVVAARSVLGCWGAPRHKVLASTRSCATSPSNRYCPFPKPLIPPCCQTKPARTRKRARTPRRVFVRMFSANRPSSTDNSSIAPQQCLAASTSWRLGCPPFRPNRGPSRYLASGRGVGSIWK